MSDYLPPKDPNLWYIYVLVNPVTEEVGYAGITIDPLKRMRSHLRCDDECNPAKNNWLATLMLYGIRPEMNIVASGYGDEWSEREQYYINKYREAGHPLTNITKGGRGQLGVTPSEEARLKISQHARSPEARERAAALGRAKKGLKLSDEVRERISRAHLNPSPEIRAKISARKLGKPWTEEQRAAIMPALRAAVQRPEYKAKMAAITRAAAHNRSAEVKQKFREQTIARNRAGRGRTLTPEHKANIAAGLRRYRDGLVSKGEQENHG